MKRVIITLIIIAAVGGGAAAYYLRKKAPEITVNTAAVTRGDIVDAVGSTGTLQAVTTVQIGSQVSGNISELGADFNSIVKKGQVIARLDPSLLDAQLLQTRANLTQSQANLSKAQSDLERTKVQLADAVTKYNRAKELSAKNLLPPSELDSAKVAVDTAQAAVQSQLATITQVSASVKQSEASVSQAQVNLDHTVIAAPIDGIVIQRSVDVGQTVAASMSAPTLFIIAADLTKMQVNATIDESDVGRIRPGQPVTFRVDAYPGQQFDGTVAQVRLQPKVVQNVTTYETIINVPNPELKLKPGMTANLRVEIAHRSDVLRLPAAALRFRPTAEVFAALNQTPPPDALPGGRGGRGRAAGGQSPAGTAGSNVAAAQSAGAAPKPVAPAPAGRATPGTPAPQSADAAGDGTGTRRGSRGEGGGDAGGGSRGGFGRGGTGGDAGDRNARLLERLKTMSPDEQIQMLARMKERGQDTAALEASLKLGTAKTAARAASAKAKTDAAATTIDALFPALPVVETAGSAWLYDSNKQLKRIPLRLGLSDGTQTEVISGDLEPGMEVVTGVIVGNARQTPQPGGNNNANPLLPNQRGNFQGGGRGRG